MMVEEKRGCGWRKVGGAYLVGEGLTVECDALPLDLEPCGECGYAVPFSRGIQEIHSGYLTSKVEKAHQRLPRGLCKDSFPCPICGSGLPKKIFLMYVSQEYYTPESFISEAKRMGVSKRIAPQSIPKNFLLGRDWIFLAHKRVSFSARALLSDEWKDEIKRGIFYAFRPQRIEMLLWKDTLRENFESEIQEWEKKGFTVVLIDPYPENVARHEGKEKASRREKQ
jgi:hypothetical protein